jgi:WD40 repeat protein
MTKRTDLRPIDAIAPPDQWPDIRERHPRNATFVPPSKWPARRVVTIVTALAVALGGLVLLMSVFHDVGHPTSGSATPTAVPALPELVVFSTADFRIAVVQPDGTGERVLTTGEEGGAAVSVGSAEVLDESPQWSKDGATIYFIRVVNGPAFWLCQIRADGSDFRVISKNLDGGHLALSPDGSRFAYDGTDGLLHLVDLGGKPIPAPEIHVEAAWGPERPAWSPDGSQIAVAGPADGTGRCMNSGCALWVMNLNTGERSNLTVDRPSDKVVSVAWSPTGQISYASIDMSRDEPSPPLRLWTIRGDGTGRVEIASDGRTIPVAWSPDGSALLVGRFGPSPYQDDRGLFIIDGGRARPVVSGADSSWGDWRA